ncbi:MAG: hypothetical protein NDJ90_11540 [Oligoflexia bacterium]|nr:hypothetical protein [Oligoflexia bacterium]
MRNLICGIALLSVLLSTAALAEPRNGEGRGFFMIGRHFKNPTALNNLLQPRGYGTFQDGILIGGQGYGVLGNGFLLGGEGYGILYGEPKGQLVNYDVSLNGALGFLNVGYLLLNDSRLHIYPMIGLGGGALHLGVHNPNVSTFDNVLTIPARSSDLTRGFLALNFSIGTDYLIDLANKEDEEGGLAIGLRAGYLLSVSRFGWEVNEAKITDGPDTALDGFYVSFMLGGGGKNPRKNCVAPAK